MIGKKEVSKLDIKQEVTNAVNNKPSSIIISDSKWRILVRNVLNAKNTMMIGATGTGKTSIVYEIAHMLNRPFFKIPLGATQDPRSTLIGNKEFIEGKGTVFIESDFVKAIQTPNSIILLDEFTRINHEAENILFTVLDHQRYLKIDEEGGRIVKVAEGVTFVATANIGSAYTATRFIDRASRDRFITIEMPFLTVDEEFNHLKDKFPDVKDSDITSLTRIASIVRDDYTKGGEVYGGELMSTRLTEDVTHSLSDGLSLRECLEEFVLPLFENEGGEDTPYLSFKALIDQELITSDEVKEDIKRTKNVFARN